MTPDLAPGPPSTAALPVLYTFRRCPYAIRARIALRYAGINVEQREVALRDKPAALLAISAKGTVPVLQLPDGKVIGQSLDIMSWALRHSDPDRWLVAADAQEALRWVHLNDDIFKPLLDRYKYAERHPELSRVQHLERALDGYVYALDQRLQTTSCLLADRISWADVAVFPFVRQFAMVNQTAFDALPLPGLQKWLGSWSSSQLFASVMKQPPSGASCWAPP